MRVIERIKFGREGGSDDMKEWTCEVEMPWSESEFFALATGTPHPMEAEPVLSDRTKRAIFDILTTSRKEWLEMQAQKLQCIKQRREDLAEEELAAKEKLRPEVRKVNSNKNLLLSAELLRGIDYPDMDVIHRCFTGFLLIGAMPEVPIFERRHPDEVILGADPVWIARTAEFARRNLIKQVEDTPVDDVLRDIYKTTTHPEEGEVALGWADGPYTEERIHAILGERLWIGA